MTQIGDPCPHCQDGIIGVVNTIPDEANNRRTRYLGCKICKYRPEDNKQIIPLDQAPGRPVMRRFNLRRRED